MCRRLANTNYLRPDLKRGLLSDDEEKIVIDLQKQLGNRYISATLDHSKPSHLHVAPVVN
jgi:hypothetical protein